MSANSAIVLSSAESEVSASEAVLVSAANAHTGEVAAAPELVNCYFDCGPPRPTSDCIRTSERGRWTCRPCYNAKRAIEQACRRDKASRDAMEELKAKDHESWMAKVRACRIAIGEANSVGHRASRQGAVANTVKSITQSVGIREYQPVYHLTKKRYLAYRQHWEGDTPEEAEAKWQADLVNPEIRRSGEGANVELAVAGWRTTEGFRERSQAHSLVQSAEVHTASQANTAMGNVAKLGASSTALHGQAFGQLGGLFRPGAASSSAGGEYAWAPMTANAPSTCVVSDTDFAQRAAAKASGGRALKANPSDPERANKRRRKVEAHTGVTGRLAETQAKAVAIFREIISVNGRANLGKKVKDWYAKMANKEIPTMEANLILEYEDHFEPTANSRDTKSLWPWSIRPTKNKKYITSQIYTI